MTEVPEHLLERSREARARMTGEGGGDATPPAADSGSAVEPAAAAPVAAAAAAPAQIEEKPPEPVAPFVEADLARKKVPVWAFSVVMLLPVWAFFYVGTLERPPVEGILTAGEEVYSSCAGCHGAGGGGGTGRPLAGGEVVETFPDAASHVWWIVNGSPAANTPYGNPDRADGQRTSLSWNGGPMAEFATSLSAVEILEVVYYERVAHGEQDLEAVDLLVIEELAEHGSEFGLPEDFEPGMTIEEIQALFDLVIEERELAGE